LVLYSFSSSSVLILLFFSLLFLLLFPPNAGQFLLCPSLKFSLFPSVIPRLFYKGRKQKFLPPIFSFFSAEFFFPELNLPASFCAPTCPSPFFPPPFKIADSHPVSRPTAQGHLDMPFLCCVFFLLGKGFLPPVVNRRVPLFLCSLSLFSSEFLPPPLHLEVPLSPPIFYTGASTTTRPFETHSRVFHDFCLFQASSFQLV